MRTLHFTSIVIALCLRHACAVAAEPWDCPVRIDPARPYHFTRTDGEPVFVFNQTAWHYFTTPDPLVVLDRAERIGANVLRVGLECRYYFADLGWDAWPWGGTREAPDFTSFDERCWAQVDARMNLAAARGIGINLTLFTSLQMPDDPASWSAMQPYLERVIARLAPHPNVFCWEIHNEHIANPVFQRTVAEYLQARDPARRPVMTSNGTTDSPIWPEAPWLDAAVVHHCTGNQPDYDLRDWYLGIARNLRGYGKPGHNNETGRERRHRNDDPVHRRKQLWIAAAAGTYTTWHAWDGCEGIANPDYRAPGEEFAKPFATWWRTQRFAAVAPVFTVLHWPDDSPFATTVVPVVQATPDRELVLAYAFTRDGGATIPATTLAVRLPGGAYRVSIFEPATGQPLAPEQSLTSPGLHAPAKLTLPAFVDDLAWRIERIDSDPHAPRPLPGTG